MQQQPSSASASSSSTTWEEVAAESLEAIQRLDEKRARLEREIEYIQNDKHRIVDAMHDKAAEWIKTIPEVGDWRVVCASVGHPRRGGGAYYDDCCNIDGGGHI